MTALLDLIGRVLLSAIFLISGIGKITGYAATQGYMASQGVPGALLPLVIALEVLAPVAIIVGWQTRIAALALAVFSIAAAVLFHADFADQMQSIMFLKNLAIAGGLFLIVAHGAGALSLDRRGRTP